VSGTSGGVNYVLNSVALCGRLTEAGIKLTYLPSGQPEAKWRLILEDPGKEARQTFKLFIPVVAYGVRAEEYASSLDAGDLVTLQGRLCWRTPPATKHEPKPQGKLPVMAWSVERLSVAMATAQASAN
jgi:single-stranded DNA-binding protein